MEIDSVSSVREKRRTRARRRISAHADKLLLILHSLFPLTVYSVLIYQQSLLSGTAAEERSAFAGYWVGGMGILLQLALIFWSILPHSDVLLLSFAVIEAVCALIGGTVTFIRDREQRFIGAVSIVSVVFTIMPMYLTITSLRYSSKDRDIKEDETEVNDRFTRLSSGRFQEYGNRTSVRSDKAPDREKESPVS
ncbi:hypothetical protein SprV_0401496000 [Sparganum proliferum]